MPLTPDTIIDIDEQIRYAKYEFIRYYVVTICCVVLARYCQNQSLYNN